MKLLNKLTFLLFAVVMLALVACGPSATPVPTATPVPPPPTAVPTPVSTKAALNLGEVMGKYNSALPDGFGGLVPAKVQEQLAAAKVFVLDVREPSEITANGYIEGAVNIPIRTLAKNLDKLPADKSAPVITYCAIGHRGAQAMATLQLLGYTNVKSILGGYNAWKAANLPVKTDAIAAPKAGTAPAVDAELLAALDKYLSGLPDGFGGVAPAALKDQLAATKVFLLDVRETSEVTANGTIEGAVNIPIRDLAKSLSKLPADKSTPIVTYCAIGHRGSFAMMYLQMMGYTNVKSILGGFNAWKGANLPVKTM